MRAEPIGLLKVRESKTKPTITFFKRKTAFGSNDPKAVLFGRRITGYSRDLHAAT